MAEGDLPAEPRHALTPGASGLEALDVIIALAPEFLESGGYLIVEHGYDQQAPVAKMMQSQGFTDIDCRNDLNGLPRASCGRLIRRR